ncbi:MAG: hypothetical protein J6X49_07230, partial [Victivallales bacterium]|nr:hypothetical protein [Victivallales bacterium]
MEGHEVINKMKSILEKNDITYSENNNSLNLSFDGSTVAGDIDIIIFIHGSFCISYCMTNVRVKMRTQQVAEYINRANFGLPNGYFVLNYHDGRVIYHTSLPLETIMNNESLAICMMVVDGLKKTKQYIPGLIAVELGLQTPEDAATHADNSPHGTYDANDDDDNDDD